MSTIIHLHSVVRSWSMFQRLNIFSFSWSSLSQNVRLSVSTVPIFTLVRVLHRHSRISFTKSSKFSGISRNRGCRGVPWTTDLSQQTSSAVFFRQWLAEFMIMVDILFLRTRVLVPQSYGCQLPTEITTKKEKWPSHLHYLQM